MFHAIYVSTATVPLPESAAIELLEAARKRNQRLGLTGLLLYSNQRFLQVLEGPESAVVEVYASIERDNRHTDIDRLRFEAKGHRDFPNWRMGYRDFSEDALDLPGVSGFLQPGFDSSAFREDNSDAYRMLMVFRDAQDIARH